MVDEVLKEVDVNEVLNEDVKDEQDEIDVVVENVEVNDECGENEDVKDELMMLFLLSILMTKMK